MSTAVYGLAHVVATYTNAEYSITSLVMQEPQGDYSVSLRDDDAEMLLSVSYHHITDLAIAMNKAKQLVA